MDVRNWLRSIGLERYADAFEENELVLADLPDLTVADIKDDLGVRRLPDRKKLIKAIEALAEGGPPTAPMSADPQMPPIVHKVPEELLASEDPMTPDRTPTPDPLPPAAEAAPEKPARTLSGRSRRSAPGDPYVGSVLGGKYRVDAPVNRPGPSGQVYRATQTAEGTAVALKVIPADLTQDAAALDAYQDVARRAGQLGAPPFVLVHDFGDANGDDKYLVTDFVGGSSLGNLLESSGPMDPKKALDVAGQVAGALETAHDADLLHGDIKPANVLFGEDGETVRISDFGVVRLMPSGAMTSLNESDRWLSGAEYLAPEQALGEGSDQRTDVYAVGVLLYEMLTGRPPFVSGSGTATLKRVIYEKPLPLHLHKTVPGLSNDLEAVVMRALSKSPTGRFRSMSDFRQAIEHLTRKAANGVGIPEAAPKASPGATTVMEALPPGVIAAAKAEAEAKAAETAEAEAAEAEAADVEKAASEAEASKTDTADHARPDSEDAKTTMILTAAPTASALAEAKPTGAGKPTEAELPRSRRKRRKRNKKGPASTVQAVGGAAAAIRTDKAGEDAVVTNRPEDTEGYAWEVAAIDGQAEIDTEPREIIKSADAAVPQENRADAQVEEKAPGEGEEEGPAKEEAEAAPERETKKSRSKDHRAKARRRKKRPLTGDEAAPEGSAGSKQRKGRRRTRTGEQRARTPNERVYTGEFEHVQGEVAPGKGDEWFVSSAIEMAQSDVERHYEEDEGKLFGLSSTTLIALGAVGGIALLFIILLATVDDKAAPDLRPSVQAEQARAKIAAANGTQDTDATDGGSVLTGGGGSQIGLIMGKADQAFRQGRFLPPAAANVREFIDEIRAIDPDNAYAKDLEARAAEKLSKDARRAYKKRKWDKAHAAYTRVVQFAPWDEPAKKRLAELAEKLGLTTAEVGPDAGETPPVAGVAGVAGVADGSDTQLAVASLAPSGAADAAGRGGQPPPVVKAPPPPKAQPAKERAPKKKKRAKAAPAPRAKAAPAPTPSRKAARRPAPKPRKVPKKLAQASPGGAGNARRLVNEGRRKLRNAKYPDARKAFTDAIKANPRSAAAHAGLGEVSFQMGRFADAVRYHRKAIEMDRNNGKYHTSLANAYYKLREYARAIAHWKRALELDPSNSLARSYIRIAQQKLNSER